MNLHDSNFKRTKRKDRNLTRSNILYSSISELPTNNHKNSFYSTPNIQKFKSLWKKKKQRINHENKSKEKQSLQHLVIKKKVNEKAQITPQVTQPFTRRFVKLTKLQAVTSKQFKNEADKKCNHHCSFGDQNICITASNENLVTYKDCTRLHKNQKRHATPKQHIVSSKIFEKSLSETHSSLSKYSEVFDDKKIVSDIDDRLSLTSIRRKRRLNQKEKRETRSLLLSFLNGIQKMRSSQRFKPKYSKNFIAKKPFQINRNYYTFEKSKNQNLLSLGMIVGQMKNGIFDGDKSINIEDFCHDENYSEKCQSKPSFTKKLDKLSNIQPEKKPKEFVNNKKLFLKNNNKNLPSKQHLKYVDVSESTKLVNSRHKKRYSNSKPFRKGLKPLKYSEVDINVNKNKRNVARSKQAGLFSKKSLKKDKLLQVIIPENTKLIKKSHQHKSTQICTNSEKIPKVFAKKSVQAIECNQKNLEAEKTMKNLLNLDSESSKTDSCKSINIVEPLKSESCFLPLQRSLDTLPINENCFNPQKTSSKLQEDQIEKSFQNLPSASLEKLSDKISSNERSQKVQDDFELSKTKSENYDSLSHKTSFNELQSNKKFLKSENACNSKQSVTIKSDSIDSKSSSKSSKTSVESSKISLTISQSLKDSIETTNKDSEYSLTICETDIPSLWTDIPSNTNSTSIKVRERASLLKSNLKANNSSFDDNRNLQYMSKFRNKIKVDAVSKKVDCFERNNYFVNFIFLHKAEIKLLFCCTFLFLLFFSLFQTIKVVKPSSFNLSF